MNMVAWLLPLALFGLSVGIAGGSTHNADGAKLIAWWYVCAVVPILATTAGSEEDASYI